MLAVGTLARAAPSRPSVPAPLAQTLQGDSKSAYEQGRQLYDDGDAAGAFIKFKRAYELSKEPRLLWNMAACEKAQRHYARAYTLIGRYLGQGAQVLTAESRAAAEETRRALRAFYSLVELRGAPSGAHVLVDGEEVGTTPMTELAIDLGEHTIGLELGGFEPFTTRVDVPGRTDTFVTVTMSPRANTTRLAIVAGPDDAIAIDDRIAGTSRWEGALVAGEHSLTVTRAGKKPYRTTLHLAAGSTRTMEVTLESEHEGALWPWIVGSVALAGGAVVGGYFLLKPREEAGTAPIGRLDTVVVPAEAFRR